MPHLHCNADVLIVVDRHPESVPAEFGSIMKFYAATDATNQRLAQEVDKLTKDVQKSAKQAESLRKNLDSKRTEHQG